MELLPKDIGLSKSKYVTYLARCPKMLWMDVHKRVWFDASVLDQARLDEGSAVGDLAMGYYGDYVEVSFDANDLPALFPDDPEFDYHALDGIHNGSEAMAAFPKLAGMPPEERDKVRNQLLRYCELDTLAMVRIWQKLQEVSKG